MEVVAACGAVHTVVGRRKEDRDWLRAGARHHRSMCMVLQAGQYVEQLRGASFILLKKTQTETSQQKCSIAGDLKSLRNRSYVRHVYGYCFRGKQRLESKPLGRLLWVCVGLCGTMGEK